MTLSNTRMTDEERAVIAAAVREVRDHPNQCSVELQAAVDAYVTVAVHDVEQLLAKHRDETPE